MATTERYPFSFYLVIVANLFFFSGFQWTFATLPGYVQEIGGDAAQIGLAFGLFSLSAVAARPVVGWLVDHWGRKPVLLVGAAMFAVSPALYTLTDSLWLFQLVRVFHGAGIAAFTTAYTTLVADLASPARRGEAVGLSGVTNNLGMLLTPVLGVYVVNAWGYAPHFLISAGITVLALVFLLPVREPRPQSAARQSAARQSAAQQSAARQPAAQQSAARQPAAQQSAARQSAARRDTAAGPSLRAVARLRPVWVAAFGISGLAVAYGAVLSFLAPFAADRGLSTTGGYFSAFAVAMMAAQASAGWLSDRVGRRAVAIPGMIVSVPAMIALAMVRSDAALLVAGAVFGLSWGLARAGIDTTVVDAVEPEARGTAVSFLYTIFDTGVAVGSFGLGVIAQGQGYGAVFYSAAAWAVLALAGYVGWGRREQ